MILTMEVFDFEDAEDQKRTASCDYRVDKSTLAYLIIHYANGSSFIGRFGYCAFSASKFRSEICAYQEFPIDMPD